MNSYQKLRTIYKKALFQPTFTGLFVNPFYIIRRGLFRGITANTHYLSGKILDFGCGDKPYKDYFKYTEYIGLDIEQRGHTHEQEDVDVFYDGQKIPFADNYFDSVFSSEVLEHVFEPEDALDEINRVLKPGGRILMTVPFVWDEHEIPYDYGRYSSFGIRYLLEKKGFEIIKLDKSTNYVQTLFQMWNTYVHQHILRVKIFQRIFTPVLITPITILGLFLGFILPRSRNFYHNNIIVAKKKDLT